MPQIIIASLIWLVKGSIFFHPENMLFLIDLHLEYFIIEGQ